MAEKTDGFKKKLRGIKAMNNTLLDVRDQNDFLSQKQKIAVGIKNDNEFRNCSFTGFLHNKRMYYLENYKGTEDKLKELKNLKTNKEKLEFFKKEIKENNILTEEVMKNKMKQGFRKKFLNIFKTEPSKDDFLNLDEDLNAKCKNLPNIKPFVPDDPTEMGGHPGAFINVVVDGKGEGECDIWGGKKWEGDSIIEYAFYQYIYRNKDNNELDDDVKKLFESLTKNISDFKLDSKCKPSNPIMGEDVINNLHNYFPIENAKNLVREGDEKIHYLDFKLGYRTAFKHEKGLSGIKSTKIRDKDWSHSIDIGFRLEGSSFIKKLIKVIKRIPAESGWKDNIAQSQTLKKTGIKKFQKADQYMLYLLNPGFIFDSLFYNTSDEHIRQFKLKLEEFENDFINKNFKNYSDDKKTAVAFIGCSIFIVMGNKGIDFKLIDFAHPYVLSSIQDGDVKKLNPDDKSCCAVNIVTGEEFKQQTSENNKLGHISKSKKKIKQEIKIADTALNTKEKIREENRKILEEQEAKKNNIKNLENKKLKIKNEKNKKEEENTNKISDLNNKKEEHKESLNKINANRENLKQEQKKDTTLFNNIKAQSTKSRFLTNMKIDDKIINTYNKEQTDTLIETKEERKNYLVENTTMNSAVTKDWENLNNEIKSLKDYKTSYDNIIRTIINQTGPKYTKEQLEKKNIPDILKELKEKVDKDSNNITTNKDKETELNTELKNDETELNSIEAATKKQEQDDEKALKEIENRGATINKQIEKDIKQLGKDNQKLTDLMKKAKSGDFSFKRNISYKEWSNTFQNFMGGLLSFVYSYYFWCNTRIYSENKEEMDKNEKELINKFMKYNKFFDNDVPGKPSTDDQKRDWDPPYPWTQSKKREKINILISKSKSNLLNRPNK